MNISRDGCSVSSVCTGLCYNELRASFLLYDPKQIVRTRLISHSGQLFLKPFRTPCIILFNAERCVKCTVIAFFSSSSSVFISFHLFCYFSCVCSLSANQIRMRMPSRRNEKKNKKIKTANIIAENTFVRE